MLVFLKQILLSLDGNEDAIVGALKQSLRPLESLGAQRAGLEDMLKEMKRKVGRIKQKRGYKDQWPWNIKIYADEFGNNKGDACLAYEDPSAAHAAGGFYNNFDTRGYKISVVMAEKSASRTPTYGHGQSSEKAQDVLRNGRRSGSAVEESNSLECNACKSVIRCVEACQLLSVFNIDGLKKVARMEKEKADRKKLVMCD